VIRPDPYVELESEVVARSTASRCSPFPPLQFLPRSETRNRLAM
jgi:hypothetical protein